MAMLERGGNAFDAAAAAGFVLQVVEPHLNGPGGDVPIVLYRRARGRVEVICGQGPAPAAARRSAHYAALGLDLVPGTGLLPAVVPGAVRRLDAAAARPRHDALRDVLEPAIDYRRARPSAARRAVGRADRVA